MKLLAIATLAAAPVITLAAAPVHAEIPRAEVRNDAVPAVAGGLELVIGIGAARTTGDVGGGLDAGDTVGTATEIALEIGHRITPHLNLGLYSTAQGNARGSDAMRDVYTGAAGLEADFHLRPRHALDPWVSAGAGVRAMLVDHTGGGLDILVGAELARLQVGLDLRVNEHLAIAPVLGATASLYGAQRPAMGDFAELDDKGITWTFTAGLAGRINLLGTRR